MDDRERKFEIHSLEKMKRRYYPPGEASPQIQIDPEQVPESLRHLILLAERWGISDDVLRADAVHSASPDEVSRLRDAIERHDDLLDKWLAGPEALHDRLSPAYLAFTHMRMAADGC